MSDSNKNNGKNQNNKSKMSKSEAGRKGGQTTSARREGGDRDNIDMEDEEIMGDNSLNSKDEMDMGMEGNLGMGDSDSEMDR